MFQAPEISYAEFINPFKADVFSLVILLSLILLDDFLFTVPDYFDEANILVAKKEMHEDVQSNKKKNDLFGLFKPFLSYDPLLRTSDLSLLKSLLEKYFYFIQN